MSATYGGFRRKPAAQGDRRFEPGRRGMTRWLPLGAATLAIAVVFWTGAGHRNPTAPTHSPLAVTVD